MFNINANVLRVAGDVLYANGDYEQSISAYEECSMYSQNPDDLIKAGIAYYKLALRDNINRIPYLKRAKDLIEKAINTNDTVKGRYYYALILIELGEAKEAAENLSLILDFIEDNIVASTIESYVFLRQLDLEADKEAYQYIDDPFLISLYDFIKTRLPEEVFDELMMRHGSKNKYVNLAKELKELYSKFVVSREIKRLLKSPVERYVLLIYALLRGRHIEEINEAINIIKNKDFRKLPPYTRGIIKSFMDYLGFEEEEELPYFIQKDVEIAEKISDLIKRVNSKSINKDELIKELKIIKSNLIAEKNINECKELIEELKDGVISTNDLIIRLRRIFIKHLLNTYVRITAFYNQKSALSLFKSILSSLNIEDRIKMDVLSKL